MKDQTASASAAQPATPLPRRWMVAQTSALLDSVATTNVVCYGRFGVPHYPVTPAEAQPDKPATLCTELRIQAPDGSMRLALLDLDLVQTSISDKQTVWSGYHAERRMQVIWVWDFFRILSHVVLRIGVPREGQTSDALWQTTLDVARAMAAGDVIAFKVQSQCGNIHQQHTLTSAPFEWDPER